MGTTQVFSLVEMEIEMGILDLAISLARFCIAIRVMALHVTAERQ